MSLYVIAEIKHSIEKDSGIYGYRLFDNKEMKFIDATYDSVVNKVIEGISIRGLEPVIELDSSTKEGIRIVNFRYTYGRRRVAGDDELYINTMYNDSFSKDNPCYWTVVGKNEYGVRLINYLGEIRDVSLKWLKYHGLATLKINNIKRGYNGNIEFIGIVDDITICFKHVDGSIKINSKLELLGINQYRIDEDGRLVILDRRLKSIKIPDICREIDDNMFRETPLESIQLGKNIERIGASAFSGCNKLREIEIPGSVETIERYAFANCTRLSKVVLNEGIKDIRSGVFGNCHKLTHIRLPRTLNKHAYILGVFNERSIPLVVEVPEGFKIGHLNYKERNIELKIY